MKTGALWTILIIIAIFTFLALLKATVTIAYAGEVKLFVKVLCFKIKLVPSKGPKKAKGMSAKKAQKLRDKLAQKAKKKKEAKLAKEKKKEEKKDTKEKKSLAEILDIISLVSKLAVGVIRTFFKHLSIKVARIKMVIATSDAATTAIAYGAATQALNLLLPRLEKLKNFKNLDKSEIAVSADFTAEAPVIDVELSFSIRVWHIFAVAFSAVGTFIKHKLHSNVGKDKNKEAPQVESKKNNDKK